MDAQQIPTEPRTGPNAAAVALHRSTANQPAAVAGHAPAPIVPCDRELDELLAQAAHRARLLGQAQFEAIARHHVHPDLPHSGLHPY